MALRYPTLDSWLLAQLNRLNLKYDNFHLNTGEEGDAKSTWSRLVARRLDYLMRTPKAGVQLQKDGPFTEIREHWTPSFPLPPPFSLDGVCFGQDQLLRFLASNAEALGTIAIGDEIEGHKRLAMHGHRQVLLDHTKEARFFRHNVWLNYPHPDQFERDLFRTRLKWWEHQDRRGHVVIRERPRGRIMFDKGAEMSILVTWPVVARFTWKNTHDPWEQAYEEKKWRRAQERMTERLRALGEEPDETPAPPRQVDPAAKARIEAVWADIGLEELKR